MLEVWAVAVETRSVRIIAGKILQLWCKKHVDRGNMLFRSDCNRAASKK